MPETVPTYRAAQVRAAEQPLLAAGIPLMARAAAALASIVQEELTDAVAPRILVLAGSGDNGGDAMFAAASLAASSAASVDVLLVSERFHAEGFAAAAAAGARRVALPEALAASYDLALDGIVGIGASPPLRGTAREVVEALLPLELRVVAVDVPSGLDPDSGSADDIVLPADVTVTFGAVKAGLAVDRGPELCGRVVLVDIGLGDGLAAEVPVGEALIDRVVCAGL